MSLNFEDFSKHKPTSQEHSYLKIDILGTWLDQTWVSAYPEHPRQIIWTSEATVNQNVLGKFESSFELEGDYRYDGKRIYPCPVVANISQESHLEGISYQSGAALYRFTHEESGDTVDVLVAAAFTSDDFYDNEIICLAAMPPTFTETWRSFTKECKRINWSLNPKQQVYIIGGRESSFVPDTEWDDIILPEDLKQSILDDVSLFYDKGIH
ncbi:MAG: hypothetical protein AAF125_23740, partial [Chloroflexota bacterium]